jgi:hypothetical protein
MSAAFQKLMFFSQSRSLGHHAAIGHLNAARRANVFDGTWEGKPTVQALQAANFYMKNFLPT